MKVFAYIKKLISNKSNESSKRFVALSITILVYYGTIRFANSQNIVLILGELLTFILVIFGVASWETIKKR